MEVMLLGETSREYLEKQAKIVATAAMLSRFKGNVLEIYENLTDDYEKNIKFIQRVINMGHDSITDHDYVVVALKDVSVLVEQVIIEQRFCSFTIKSRREVDFSTAGYYVPDFHDSQGNIVKENEALQEIYKQNMEILFKEYSGLLKQGVKAEDARYILPYCFHSNIVMGLDAHTLKDLIIDLTKGKNSNITELRELGEKLSEMMEQRCPYIKKVIDKSNQTNKDEIEEYLNKLIPEVSCEILEKPELLSCSDNIDDTLFISAIMRVYGIDYHRSSDLYKQYIQFNPEIKEKLMKLINKDKKDLGNINFLFQIPTSLAVLTHFTRHRTHSLAIPDFVPIKNLEKYKIPQSFKDVEYPVETIFENNRLTYQYFKDRGIRDEDLVYFYLAGNMFNIVSNMDGKTLSHILKLRCCEKTQWETRQLVNEMRNLVATKSEYLPQILGPTCEVEGKCYEGKECCGKIKKLEKNKNSLN